MLLAPVLQVQEFFRQGKRAKHEDVPSLTHCQNARISILDFDPQLLQPRERGRRRDQEKKQHEARMARQADCRHCSGLGHFQLCGGSVGLLSVLIHGLKDFYPTCAQMLNSR